MKPPPFLLGATLLFWGWQTGFLLPGALMGVIVESALVFKARWDLSDDDYGRIWSFCSLLLLAAVVFAFTANEGPANFGGLFEDYNIATQRNATISGARTATAVLRWLPMLYFPFLAAQAFSTREAIPLATISHILQRRWKRAKRLGQPLPSSRSFNIGYTYFAATLLSASFHPAENTAFFWGFCGLLTWVLWAHRSRRYPLWVWATVILLAAGLGFWGQRGLGFVQRYTDFVNPQWLAYFLRRHPDPTQSRTALGRVGEIKLSDKIVIRLQPRRGSVPTYLRETSYRIYKGQTWYAGSSRDSFADVREEPPDSGSRQLLAGKTNGSCISIACYLEGFDKAAAAGLLPLPSGSYRLERLPAYLLSKSTAGAVLANGPRLMIFDAFYGPGATIDSPPGTGAGLSAPAASSDSAAFPTNFVPSARYWLNMTNEDLVVPEREEAALDQVIAELKLRELPHAAQVQQLAKFFAEQFTYSLWQKAPTGGSGTNETPLSRFLLQTRKGHCEYFATATVLLLRRLGIPARYATGYAVHEAAGNGYVVRLADAHAWTLLWDEDKQIWTDYETTPASWVEIEGQQRSPFRWLIDAWSRLGFEFSKFRWGQTKVRQYLLWAIVPGLGLLLYQILFRRRRKQRAALKTDAAFLASWPGLDSEFYQLEKEIADRGVRRRSSEPLNEWFARVVAAPDLADLREPMRELLRLHYRHRFDPLGLDAADRSALRERTQECLRLLRSPRPSAAAGSG